MFAYFISVVQHLKEVSSNQQSFIVKELDARKICCPKDSTNNFAQGPYIKYVGGGEAEGFCGGHEVFQVYIDRP